MPYCTCQYELHPYGDTVAMEWMVCETCQAMDDDEYNRIGELSSLIDSEPDPKASRFGFLSIPDYVLDMDEVVAA